MSDQDRAKELEREPDLPKKWVLSALAVVLALGVFTGAVWLKSQRDVGTKTPPKGAPLAFLDVAPVALDVNEDGEEDFAAVARDATGKVAVVAFNGKTLREVWHTEGIDALDHAWLVVLGGTLVVVDAHGAMHVLLARSGRSLREATLPSSPAFACAEGRTAYFGLVDHRVYALDLGAAAAREAGGGEGGCARRPWEHRASGAKRVYAVSGGRLTVAESDGRVVGVVDSR